MKTWLTKIAVAVLGIAIIVTIPTGVWAMIISGGGEPVPPVLQLAGTCVRATLGLAVMAAPGVLFWLVVVGIVVVIQRVCHVNLFRTIRDGTVGAYPSPDRPDAVDHPGQCV
jgi:hypothetical protein